MKKIFLVIVIAFVNITILVGQENNIWKPAKNATFKLEKKQIDNTRLFNLNLEFLKNELKGVPKRDMLSQKTTQKTLNFPMHNGEFLSFNVSELSTLAPELSQKFPNIKSYEGVAISNPLIKIRFNIDPYDGFHGMIVGDGPSTYINPTENKSQLYYLAKSSEFEPTPFECGVKETLENETLNKSFKSSTVTDGLLRTYRLALACNGQYGAYHVNQAGVSEESDNVKKAAVLAAMNIVITRMNGLFEREISVNMQIIANNDAIIFLDQDTDPYEGSNNSDLFSENITVVNNFIGTSNYDIGHVFSRFGGGIAAIGATCSSGKAAGASGRGNPRGNRFELIVAHEMGHQFGARHIYNNSCGGNRSSLSAMEPGSGSTIMSYAGACSPNVKSLADDYFNARNILQMYSRIIGFGGSCANNTSTGNIEPIISAGNDYNIPKGTAFVLEASVTDANASDVLTYCWEQQNNEITTQPPSPNSTEGPAFRSRLPNTSPKRYCPQITDILSNNLTPTWDVVSNEGRSYNFSLLVRDNRSGGGQTGRDDVVITSIDQAGPFLITSQNTSSSLLAGETINVTWDVANTNMAPINTETVSVFFIIDNDFENLMPVLQNTPNDGTTTVVVPNTVVSSNARILIKADDNIYFDINDAVLEIQENNLSVNQNDFDSQIVVYPNPFETAINISIANFRQSATIEVFTLTGKKIYDKKFNSTDANGEINVNLQDLSTGVYFMSVEMNNTKYVKKIIKL